jgi:hypothetical protein
MNHVAAAIAFHLKHRAEPIKHKRRPTAGGRGADEHGNHQIVPRRLGGWECSLCRGFALGRPGLRILSRRECRGRTGSMIHETHQLRNDRGTLWCQRCGCYTTRWPRELRKPCTGRPQTAAQCNVLRRLMAGLAPTTADYLAEVEVDWYWKHGVAAIRSAGAGSNGGQSSASAAAAAAPSAGCGKYLRLPGGPLYRHRAHAGVQRSPREPDAPDLARDDGGDAVHESGADGNFQDVVRRRIRCKSAPPAFISPGAAAAVPGDMPGIEDARDDAGDAVQGHVLGNSAGDDQRRYEAMNIAGKRNAEGNVASASHIADADRSAEAANFPERPSCAGPFGTSWIRRIVIRPTAGQLDCSSCGERTAARCRQCGCMICVNCAKHRRACRESSQAPTSGPLADVRAQTGNVSG